MFPRVYKHIYKHKYTYTRIHARTYCEIHCSDDVSTLLEYNIIYYTGSLLLFSLSTTCYKKRKNGIERRKYRKFPCEKEMAFFPFCLSIFRSLITPNMCVLYILHRFQMVLHLEIAIFLQ